MLVKFREAVTIPDEDFLWKGQISETGMKGVNLAGLGREDVLAMVRTCWEKFYRTKVMSKCDQKSYVN